VDTTPRETDPMAKLDPALTDVLQFLNRNPQVRQRIPAPPDKTVVYSGGFDGLQPRLEAWRAIDQARKREPQRFDVVTLEERLGEIHVPAFGATLYDHALKVSRDLGARGKAGEATILWRALSGIYVQGARGRVRALVLPGPVIAGSVFNLTEVHVLLRPDVLQQIQIDAERLREFRIMVRAGLTPAPIVVM
jgi:hypothetical protein